MISGEAIKRGCPPLSPVKDGAKAGLQKTADMLRYKCWYYETAIRDGSEDRLNAMIPDDLPPEIRKLYDNMHG